MASLTPEMIALLAAGVAHQVGAASRDGRPTHCRGLAATVEDDGRLAVVLSATSGFEVLAALAETRRISLNVTLPSTYQSLNLAGRDAEVDAAGGARYRALVDARRAAFARQLEPYGYPVAYFDAWYSAPDEDLAVIRFTPETARNQTPGLGAGNAIPLAGGT